MKTEWNLFQKPCQIVFHNFMDVPLIFYIKERFEEIVNLLRWDPTTQKSQEESPEETPNSALSFFSARPIIRKDYGVLFGFSNISSDFWQAKGELAKSLSGLGNRHKEETEIKMDQLKAEIENLKINGDKMMRLLQDLREQRKGSDTAWKEGKPRSAAIEEDWTEDEVRAAVMKGLETN